MDTNQKVVLPNVSTSMSRLVMWQNITFKTDKRYKIFRENVLSNMHVKPSQLCAGKLQNKFLKFTDLLREKCLTLGNLQFFSK